MRPIRKPAPAPVAVRVGAPPRKRVQAPAPEGKRVSASSADPRAKAAALKRYGEKRGPAPEPAPRGRAGKAVQAPAKRVVHRATRAPRAAAPSQVTPVRDQFTKAELLQHLVEQVGLDNVQLRDMKRVYAALEDVILGSLHPRGAGEFALPGIVKFATVKKPAVKGGQRKISPFTKEEYITKPKAATIKVKVRALTKVRKAALGVA